MEYSHRFFTNKDCKYYPCHKGVEDFNCLFCYCPLYNIDDCPGNPVFREKDEGTVKVCTDCSFPHQKDNYDKIVAILKEHRVKKATAGCSKTDN
ncbi:MAG: cysteine-rich small domain-containing protein [Lachnospiraceae bacterium]|nr:cysteine-rich small domain-containing protein [Lachnospiraceae bacterium]